MSMRQLLDRYAKGLPLEGEQKTPIYDEEGTSRGIDVRKLDLVDIQEINMYNKEFIQDKQDEIKRKRQQKNSKQMDLEDAIIQPEGH
jgi:hypothetical protein